MKKKQPLWKIFRLMLLLVGVITVLSACREQKEQSTPYDNWQARNAKWYLEIADSARVAIAQAKAQHGDDWKDHCPWRMYRSLLKQQSEKGGLYTDSICVRVLQHGTGTYYPTFSDTVRLNMRGWLLPSTYKRINAQGMEVDSLMQEIFTQSYFGPFNAATAAPQLLAVSSTIEGFSTALQYMVEGDDWMVYIPQQQAYGAKQKGVIPPYSTLQFRINLVAAYPVNTTIPR